MASVDDVVTNLLALVKNVGLLVQVAQQKFPDWQSVPATATSPGTPGQVAYDSTHFYVCVSANVWVRTTLATF